MARLAEVSKGDWDQFERVLAASGLTAEEVVALKNNPHVFRVMLREMRRYPGFSAQRRQAIHGVYSHPEDVHTDFRARLVDKEIDFGRFKWSGSKKPPEFDLKDPEEAVILEATLGTLQETFDFACEWVGVGQKFRLRREMSSHPEWLMLAGNAAFRPWTLKWVWVKIDSNLGRKPTGVPDVESLSGCAPLFMAAQHPGRVAAMKNGKAPQGLWLAGLRCTSHSSAKWEFRPCLTVRDDEVRIGVAWEETQLDDWSVPTVF